MVLSTIGCLDSGRGHVPFGLGHRPVVIAPRTSVVRCFDVACPLIALLPSVKHPAVQEAVGGTRWVAWVAHVRLLEVVAALVQ